jgi:hypothetical protein
MIEKEEKETKSITKTTPKVKKNSKEPKHG